MSNTVHERRRISQTDLNTIFTHFSPQDVEEFYQLYQLWSLRQRRVEVVSHIEELKQQIVENEACLNATSPSPIALATITLFRAIGVDDLDLLDRMLERGDTWLDHALQLFLHCERLDMLQGSATQWCVHALEGAYDWIESMGHVGEENITDDETLPFIPTVPPDQSLAEVEAQSETTEADFLKKLMSEEGESVEESNVSTVTIEDAFVSEKDSIEDFPPKEEVQVEDLPEYAFEQFGEYEEVEYAILAGLPDIQQENGHIEISLEAEELLGEEQETQRLEEPRQTNVVKKHTKAYSLRQKKERKKHSFHHGSKRTHKRKR